MALFLVLFLIVIAIAALTGLGADSRDSHYGLWAGEQLAPSAQPDDHR